MPDTPRTSTQGTSGHEDGRSLYSVAQIQHVLRVEFGRAQRYRYPIVCLMIAIDQLGAVRDQFGYDAKEHVFEAVVVLLVDATRGSDFLGRTADDRLLVVLPHTGIDGARTLAARLLRETRNLDLSDPLDDARVSLSIGLSFSENGASGAADPSASSLLFHDSLLQAAESALSDAVAAGGGQLVEKDPA